jgi:hypothetical protein
VSAVAPTYTAPPFQGMTTFRKLSVAEYQSLIDNGHITEDDRVELLEGYMVVKMPANPPHDSTLAKLDRRFHRMVPDGYVVRCQHGSLLPDSRPEPDLAVARGAEDAFDARHPQPADLALVIEVSDSSLPIDRVDKGRIYARVSIPQYWVVNLVDEQVEVYTDPTGPQSAPVYRRRQDYPRGTAVPVELDGTAIGTVVVDEVLP